MSRIEDALAKATKLRQSKVNGGNTPEPSPPPPSGPHKGKKIWRYCVLIPLALAAVFGMYRYFSELTVPSQPKPLAADVSEKSRSAVQKPAQENYSPQKNRLPTCIPLDSPDAAYSQAHPGWQRYKTESLEFRVFWEQSAVKAIQVISHKEKAITDAFFTSFLGEMVGRDTFKVQSGMNKNGYYIEKGKAGTTAGVIVYREMPSREIRALVVSYL